jgi:hypothetical protein
MYILFFCKSYGVGWIDELVEEMTIVQIVTELNSQLQ